MLYLSISSSTPLLSDGIEVYLYKPFSLTNFSQYSLAPLISSFDNEVLTLSHKLFCFKNFFENSINRYNNLIKEQKIFFDKEEKNGKIIAFIGIGFAIPFLICGILLQVLLSSPRISGWLLGLPYAFLPFFSPRLSTLLAQTYLFRLCL